MALLPMLMRVILLIAAAAAGSCAPLERLDPSTPAAKAERLLSDYFVFTSVRNPYTRAVRCGDE